MHEDDNIFDKEIKSILESGREEVPDRVWNAIQGRMDTGRRKAAIRWISAAAVSAAAAAVAAVAVFTRMPDNGSGGIGIVPPDGDVRILTESPAPVIRSEEENESVISGQFIPQSIDSYEPASGTTAGQTGSDAPADGGKNKQTDAEEQQEGNGQQDKTELQNKTEQEGKIEQQDTAVQDNSRGFMTEGGGAGTEDDWSGALPAERTPARKKPDVALSVFGNAISNNSGSKGGKNSAPMQSAGVIPRNEVREDMATSYGIPLSFGVGAKISFTKRWSLGAGVNWSYLTRRFSGAYYDGNGKAFSDSDIRNDQHYIGIPVNVYFSIASGDFFNFYAYAGGAVEKCVSDTYLIDTPDRSITWRGKSPGVQMSANAGIGVEFLLADRFGLYIDPSVRYYFESRQPKSIRTVQPLMLSFEAGLRIRFR